MAQKIDLGGNDLIVNDIFVGASGPGQAGTDITTTDLTALAGVTAGTVAASKAVIVDSSKNIATFGTVGSGAITSTGASSFGTIGTGATTVTSASASSLAVGPNGATTPVLSVDSSTSSAVTGLKVTGAATTGTTALVVTTDSGNANLTVNAVSAGTIGIGSVSTGRVTITPVTTITGALTTSGGITPAAGTASVAPLTLTSGTNLTTAVAGSVEYDGKVFYESPAASSRAVSDVEYFITNTATFTLTSQTAAQALFNQTGATAGSLTLPANGTYFFEGFFSLSSLSASSGSFGFALGGTANLTAINWMGFANKATLATQVAWQGTWNATNANTALTAANTNTVGAAYVKGTFTMTTTGTVIPQVSQGNAAAAVVGVGSWFRVVPVGVNTVLQVGNWS